MQDYILQRGEDVMRRQPRLYAQRNNVDDKAIVVAMARRISGKAL
jgi:hypothetical protein